MRLAIASLTTCFLLAGCAQQSTETTPPKPVNLPEPAPELTAEQCQKVIQCPKPEVIVEEKIVYVPQEKDDDEDAGQASVVTDDKEIVGRTEWVKIKAGPMEKARIDSGAKTTSIGVENIERFERDGKKWVRFEMVSREDGSRYVFKRQLVREARIRSHAGESLSRPVVEMTLEIGNLVKTAEVTLANRDKFNYAVLVGRNVLAGEVLIDVSKRFLLVDDGSSAAEAK